MNGRRRRLEPTKKWTVIGMIVFIVSIVAGPLFLLILDHWHAYLGNIYPHYFPGDVWFTALASFIAAVPGLFCGVLALVQTMRLHALEDRYHRPCLLLEEAVLKTVNLKIPASDKKDLLYQDLFRQARETLLVDDYKARLISLKLKVILKNDIILSDIRLKKVVFCLYERDYEILLPKSNEILHMEKEGSSYVKLYNKDDLPFYELKQFLFPIGNQDKVQKEFWDDLDKFINYPRYELSDHDKIRLEAQLEVSYEFGGSQSIWLTTFWEYWNMEPFELGVTVNKSRDGFFHYE